MSLVYLVVKTLTPNNGPFEGVTATFEGKSCVSVADGAGGYVKGVLEVQLDGPQAPSTWGSTTVAGAIVAQVAASDGGPAWTATQSVTVNLSDSPPTVTLSGLQSIYTLRVGVAARGTDFNVEVYFVVDATIRAALDAFKDRFAGPYNGVFAPGYYRMSRYPVGPDADAQLNKLAGQIDPDARKMSRTGKPSPEQLRNVTQALVDALHLTTPTAIRRAMFDCALGVDCTGYVYNAFLSSRNKDHGGFYGLDTIGNEALSALSGNAMFRCVSKDLQRARGGDLIALGPPPRGSVGHVVIVSSHIVEETASDLAQLGADVKALIQGWSAGPAHLYYVDASWGVDKTPDVAEGGVRRNPWAFNESTKEWQ